MDRAPHDKAFSVARSCAAGDGRDREASGRASGAPNERARGGRPLDEVADRAVRYAPAMRVAFVYVHDRFTPFSTAIAALSGASRDLGHEHLLAGIEVGMTVAEAQDRIAALAPDVIAASFMSRDFPQLARVLGEVRRRTGAFVAAGGYHATFAAPSVAACGSFDAIGIGEGERPFRRLLAALGDGQAPRSGPGLWVRGADGFAGPQPRADREPDIAALPPWDYALFGELVTRSSLYGYVRRDRFAPLRASRGCPFDCTYCSNPAWKQVNDMAATGVRNVRPVEQVASEAASLAASFGAEGFEFWDEHFPVDLRWIERFAEVWPREVGLPFRVEMHPNTATPDRLAALARAGCSLVQYGVEAGDPGFRRTTLRRRTSDEAYARVLASTRALGMGTSASVMVAMPGETYEMGRASVALLRKLAPDHMSYAAYAPLPGTDLAEGVRPRVAGDPDRFQSTFTAFEPQIEPDAMTVDEARSLLRDLGALQAELMGRMRGEQALPIADGLAAPGPESVAALRRTMGAAWTLQGVLHERERACLRLVVRRDGAAGALELEIQPDRPGQRSFAAVGELAVSYRGRDLASDDGQAIREFASAVRALSFAELVRVMTAP